MTTKKPHVAQPHNFQVGDEVKIKGTGGGAGVIKYVDKTLIYVRHNNQMFVGRYAPASLILRRAV